MLYVSTRNKTDSFTAHWALRNDRTPDGGVYVPFRLPDYDPQQIKQLSELSFAETVAQILNIFFPARLTGWDVEFCIGRYPVKPVAMNHRVVVAEIWHNPGATFDYAVNHLYTRICPEESVGSKPSQWAKIAIYIAILFGIYVELNRSGIPVTDLVLPSENSFVSVAALYARHMGLPIGKVILACKNGDPVWELVQKGSVNSSCSVFAEHLLYLTLGYEQFERCMHECHSRGMVQLTQEQLAALNHGLYAIVAGDDRIRSVISSVYRTSAAFFSPQTALSFGCLQDYRSHTGESRSSLLLAESSPQFSIDAISAATGLSVSELKKQMTLIKE